MPWRGPQYPGELPTLGYQVLDWIADYLIVPDGILAGEPLLFSGEQAQFVLDLYAVRPDFDGVTVRGSALVNGRRVRRAVLSRVKGWGKSPVMSALCLVEALGDVVPDGWDGDGEPVGRPWTSLGFKAKVQLLAVSEDQTANMWDPLLEMARNGPVAGAYAIEALDTFVNVPQGLIEFATSSSLSREGFRPVFAVLDQTESWLPSNGGVKLAATTRRNIAKVNGCSVETPNAYVPGLKSVAERSFEGWTKQNEGRLRTDAGGILFDHREAPGETDPTDRASLMAGLAYAYGDSADSAGGWVNLERILQDYWDPDTEPQDARRYYLNQITHASDSWLTQPEWAACTAAEKAVSPVEAITLGFDGSRRRAQGVTDATALMGCRLADGHLFPLGVWEQPEDEEDWRVPVHEVDLAVRETFRNFNVVAFYADPEKFEGFVAQWEADFGARLKVKSTRNNPIEWWFTGGRALQIVRALKQFHGAVVDSAAHVAAGGDPDGRELTHDGSSALARHILNARNRPSRAGMQIAKDHPDSPRKIDLAIASVLAWTARLDAIAAGVPTQSTFYMPKRLY